MLSRRQLFATAAAAPAVLRGARRPLRDKPNLLFIWTDEQRHDTLAVSGNARFRMPALNQLASESVVFRRNYVTQPVCTPSRGSIMTGLYPHQHGCVANNIPLPPATPTQPELLADSAYRTAYMGKWHLGDEIFAQHGFQEWVAIEDGYQRYFSPGRDRARRSAYHDYLLRQGYQPDETKANVFTRDFAVRLPLEHCKPEFLARNAARFILENRRDPWLLHVNFLEPHMPFFGPLNDLHSEEEAPVPRNYPGDQVDHEPEHYRKIRARYREQGFEGQDLKTRAGWQRLNRNYAGLCTQVDQAVGRMLWALEASGQADNTIVVFTSDHGEMMGSHSLIGKGVFYEEAARVPLLIRAPFLHRGQIVIDRPSSSIDLTPTLLHLLGRKPPEHLPGQSWAPYLEGGRLTEDHVFIEWFTPSGGPHARCVVSPEGDKLALFDRDHHLFFRTAEDPLELDNRYYRAPPQAEITALRKRLDAWQRATRDTLALS
jgi:arylsulfatase A-like enzyme